jgi:hypothetical protein
MDDSGSDSKFLFEFVFISQGFKGSRKRETLNVRRKTQETVEKVNNR